MHYLVHVCYGSFNHYHLIIETPIANVNKVMHYLNGSYTGYLNRRRKRSGHLFQGRYKSILVDVDSYLLELSRYVHLNPVKVKMVSRPEDYPYSSYKSYISSWKKDALVHNDVILGMLSKEKKIAKKSYKAFVEKGIKEKVENPLKDLYGGSILGGKDFIKGALSRLKGGAFQKQEVSHRRELDAAFVLEHIIEAVASHFKVSVEDCESACNNDPPTSQIGVQN